jgi:hypothetical protein
MPEGSIIDFRPVGYVYFPNGPRRGAARIEYGAAAGWVSVTNGNENWYYCPDHAPQIAKL